MLSLRNPDLDLHQHCEWAQKSYKDFRDKFGSQYQWTQQQNTVGKQTVSQLALMMEMYANICQFRTRASYEEYLVQQQLQNSAVLQSFDDTNVIEESCCIYQQDKSLSTKESVLEQQNSAEEALIEIWPFENALQEMFEHSNDFI